MGDGILNRLLTRLKKVGSSQISSVKRHGVFTELKTRTSSAVGVIGQCNRLIEPIGKYFCVLKYMFVRAVELCQSRRTSMGSDSAFDSSTHFYQGEVYKLV